MKEMRRVRSQQEGDIINREQQLQRHVALTPKDQKPKDIETGESRKEKVWDVEFLERERSLKAKVNVKVWSLEP